MTASAVITFAFDPLLHFGDLTVRIQTVALAAIMLAALLVLALVGRVTPMASPYVPAPTLRPGDIPFLVLGLVPGAVLGGRLDYVLVHLDYYAANPAAILDPAQGSLGLGLAVPGAILGSAIIGRLIDTPMDRWFHAAALPTVFALGAGKLSGILAAEGQGQPADVAWATAYLGDGPWSSLAAHIPSHPSQVYEAAMVIGVLALVGLALGVGAFARRDGSVLFFAVGLWAIARSIAASTWRDAPVLGPLRAEQLILFLVVLVCMLYVLRVRGSAGSRAPVRRRLLT